MKDLIAALSDGSYVVEGGVLDPNAFHVCLLALIMDVRDESNVLQTAVVETLLLFLSRRCHWPVLLLFASLRCSRVVWSCSA